MNMNTNLFEKSWKEFTSEFQKHQKIWNKMTEEYFDHLNMMRKNMLTSFQEQYNAANDKAEDVLKEISTDTKKALKDVTQKIEKHDDPDSKKAVESEKSQVLENWTHLMSDAQKYWSKLTNDNLKQINGSREKLSDVLQKNYGIAREEAEKQMNDWEKSRAKIVKTATS